MITKVLKQLVGLDNEQRKAKFKTVIALIINNKAHQFTGEVEGYITTKPMGSHGFGYDPIFYYPPFGKTFAQMTI